MDSKQFMREGRWEVKRVRRPAMYCFVIAFEEKALSTVGRRFGPPDHTTNTFLAKES
jgi:hypothetical protein